MKKAFVLGAGLGTRLRPLTEAVPKPLVPVRNRPLITHAFDHLASLGVREFIVNTHHRAEAYAAAFPDSRHRGIPIRFRHEPILLETGGGIANVADLIGDDDFVVYNGDILSDLALAPALEAHEESGRLVTLVLRSSGAAMHVTADPAAGRVVDIRNSLGSGLPENAMFTGIYFVRRGFVDRIPPREKISVIPVLLDLMRAGGEVGAVFADEGAWFDLGTREAYLDTHAALGSGPLVAESASVAGTAELLGFTTIGEGAVVGPQARLEDSVVWPGATVAPHARLRRCVVRTGETATGEAENRDF